ncbi:MAG: glycosyltransferase family 4 protein, partial [Bacillota bacterium]
MENKLRIKVLHVAPLPPPLGGMVTYIQGLLNSAVFKKIDYKVVRLNYINKENYKGVVRLFINLLNTTVLTSVFIVKTITWHPDIVHIQSNSGFGYFEKSWIALLAKGLGCKTIFHFHGGNFLNFYKESTKFRRKLIKQLALINNRVLTGSPQMKSNWSDIGIPEKKIVYIGNAVNIPDLSSKQFHNSVNILFLTRIVLEKGIIELIDAFLQLKLSYTNLNLRIVGVESLDAPIIKEHLRSNDLKRSIEYIGPVTDEQKHLEYLNADIFAFPTYFED